ncbi:MAG: hypothetical protein NC131_15380 [Roseburia sp.]|nr:hypothetical protein [Roseburia sp.]
MSINLRRSASILSEEEQTALLKLIDDDRVQEFNIESKVTECKECQMVGSQIIIDVIEHDKTKHRFNGKCNACKNDIIVYETGAQGEYTCSKCGQGTLKMEASGVWD